MWVVRDGLTAHAARDLRESGDPPCEVVTDRCRQDLALFTEYKYTDSTFRFGGAFGTVGGFDATYRAHQLFVGLSYHF